jgi:hypothetical protein
MASSTCGVAFMRAAEGVRGNENVPSGLRRERIRVRGVLASCGEPHLGDLGAADRRPCPRARATYLTAPC